jgi:hypothetical protein
MQKNFKKQTAAGNIMASVLGESEGNLSVEFLESGATFNWERNVQTLMKLKQEVRWVRPDRKINPVLLLLLQDKARPHTSLRTAEGIETVEWSLLPHGPYSPDLAPSDFHLFGPLKDALRGRRFAKYDELKHGMREEFRQLREEFYATHAKAEREC